MVRIGGEYPEHKIVKKCSDYDNKVFYYPDRRFYEAGIGITQTSCKYSNECKNSTGGWGCSGRVWGYEKGREVGYDKN